VLFQQHWIDYEYLLTTLDVIEIRNIII
jgi:hypothetical protein